MWKKPQKSEIKASKPLEKTKRLDLALQIHYYYIRSGNTDQNITEEALK
jgi:hypothetical protein